MGKANRLRQQRIAVSRETHESDPPVRGMEERIEVDLAGTDVAESLVVSIHGVRHFLHRSTAGGLSQLISERLGEVDRDAPDSKPSEAPEQQKDAPAGVGPFDTSSISDHLARARIETRNMVRGTLGMFGPRNELTEQHFPLLGFIERAQAFSLGAIAMLESGNPLAAATLLRSLAENVATAYFVTDRPSELQKLQPGADRAPSVGKVVASAEKNLPGFKEMYNTLSSMAHPSGSGTYNTLKVADDGTFTWQSYPTFKNLGQAEELLALLDAMVHLSSRVIQATARELTAHLIDSHAKPSNRASSD